MVVQVVVQGHTFSVDPRYKPETILGRGSFGVVCTAHDTNTNRNIAIKRIRPYANDDWDARHTLREIRLMKLFKTHPNIISLYSLSSFDEKAELYMMMELMDCDLHRIIQSKQVRLSIFESLIFNGFLWDLFLCVSLSPAPFTSPRLTCFVLISIHLNQRQFFQELSDAHIKCFAKQLLEGVGALHSMGVFHRDIKPGRERISA